VFFALRWLNAVITPFLIGAILAYSARRWSMRAAPARSALAATTIVVLLFGLVISPFSWS
jgi:hypothetical protein